MKIEGHELILIIAIPFFVLSIIAEYLILKRQHREKEIYNLTDTAGSLLMGIGLLVFITAAKYSSFLIYFYVYENFRLFDLGHEWWVWTLAFFAEDFSFFIHHWAGHRIRIFWASHVSHHSSQQYNLGTALRQEWPGVFYYWICWVWMPLLGIDPVIMMIYQSTSLIYQFWIHTETIGKMPRWFEYIFNTPSHHRVHHASDEQYIDKNYGGVLIIWDRMFGTFTEETIHPKYGLTSNIPVTANPFFIAFHEWIAMFKDIARKPRYALNYMFSPPGWREDKTK